MVRKWIQVSNLVVGAYVDVLDCPWLGTPFAMQGFLLELDEDVRWLRDHCRHVGIDLSRSTEDVALHYETLADISELACSGTSEASAPRPVESSSGFACPDALSGQASGGRVDLADEVLKIRATAMRPAPETLSGDWDEPNRKARSSGPSRAIQSACHAPSSVVVKDATIAPDGPETFARADMQSLGRRGDDARAANGAANLFSIANGRLSVTADFIEARSTYAHARRTIGRNVRALASGHIDALDPLRTAVQAIVDTTRRAPDAMAFHVRLKSSDPYADVHALNDAIGLALFGVRLEIPANELNQIVLAGLLLDIGNVRVPERLLAAPARLSAPEFAALKRHVEHSIDVLAGLPGMDTPILEIIAQHHERWDGRGYPCQLIAAEMSPFARMAAIVDSFDAMTSRRPYARAMPPHQAMRVLSEARDTQFDAKLVDQFLQFLGTFPVGTLVELTSGEIGIVARQNCRSRLEPTVLVVLAPNKSPLATPVCVDLAERQKDQVGGHSAIDRDLPAGSYHISIEVLDWIESE